MLIAVIIIWLILPLGLIPATIVLAHKNKKRKEEIDSLKKTIMNFNIPNAFSENTAEKSPPDVSESASAEKTVFENIDEKSVSEKIIPENTDEIPVSETHKEKANPMNAILIIGVILIVLAGIIFSTTNWSIMGNGAKTLLIISSAVLFYAVGIFAEKKFKLEKLGKAFFSLGSIFLPITVIAVGYFQLLGGWFSLSGYYASKNLVLMIAFLTFAGTCCIASGKYKSEMFALASLSGISCAVICMILILFDDRSGSFSLVPVMFVIYSFVVMLILPKIKYAAYFSAYEKVLEKYILLNTILFSIAALVYSVSSGTDASIPLVFFGITFLDKSFNKKYSIFGIFPFAIYLLLGMTGMQIPTSCSSYIMISCSAVLTSVVISEISHVSEKLAKALRVYSYIMMSVALLASFISIINSSSTISTVISLLLIYASSIWILLKYNNKTAKYIQPFLLFTAVFHLSMLIPVSPETCYIIFFAAITLCFIAYIKFSKLRTVVSSIMFIAGTLFMVCVDASNGWLTEGFIGGLCASLMLILCVFTAFSSKKAAVAGYCVVPSLIFAFSLITDGFSEYEDMSFIIMRILFITILASVVFIPKINRSSICRKFSKCLEFWLYFLAFYNVVDTAFPYFAVIAVFCMFRIKSTLNFKMTKQASFYTYASVAYLLLAVLTIIDDSISEETFFIPFAVLGFIIMVAQIAIMLKNRDNFFNKPFYNSSRILIFLSLFIAAFSVYGYENAKIIFMMMLCLVLYIYSYTYKGSNISGALSAAMLYFYAFNLMPYNDNTEFIIYNIIAFFIAVSIGNFINDRLYTKAIMKPSCRKWITYFAVIFPFIIIWTSLNGDSELTKWTSAGWFLIAVYTSIFIRKNKSVFINRTHMTVSVIMLALAVSCQELIEIPSVLRAEFYITLSIIICIVLKKIWKGYENRINLLTLITVLIGLVYLLYNILAHKQLINAEILIAAGIFMMIFSAMKKRKKWFTLSAATVLFLAFYMTKDFWLSIQWWLYLLMAGILLVSIAGANEYIKNKGEDIKHFTDDWSKDWY